MSQGYPKSGAPLPSQPSSRNDDAVSGSTLTIGLDYRPALLSHAGIARSVRELTAALARSPDVEPHLFGHSLSPARFPHPIPPGARLHRLPIPGRSLPLLQSLRLDARRLCGGVPIFHWTDYVHPPVREGGIVLTIHDLAFLRESRFHGPTTDWLRERCLRAARRAHAIVCPSETTARDAKAAYPELVERIFVVPFGADHVPDTVGPALLDEPYILAVGTIEPRKNHVLLLEAWRALDPPRPKLVVIGREGWECASIVAELRAACATGEVRWLQDATDAEVYRWMAHALVLAYPSHLEGFGFPPLEAMRLGVPVIAGDTPALREVLGDAAWFVDVDEPEGLTARLRDLLEDPRAREERARAGRARAADFTWTRAADGYAEIYRRVHAEVCA